MEIFKSLKINIVILKIYLDNKSTYIKIQLLKKYTQIQFILQITTNLKVNNNQTQFLKILRASPITILIIKTKNSKYEKFLLFIHIKSFSDLILLKKYSNCNFIYIINYKIKQ